MILLYSGKTERSVKDFEFLLKGEEDEKGIGVYIPSKIETEISKTAYGIKELLENEPEKNRALRFTQIGSIGMKAFDTKKYKIISEQFQKHIRALKNFPTHSFLLMTGEYFYKESEKNFLVARKVRKNFYLQLGSSDTAKSIRKYLYYVFGRKTQDNDIDVIIDTYLNLKKQSYTKEKIYNILQEVFSSIGTILHIREDGLIEIIHDGSNDLYLVELSDGDYLLTTKIEPDIDFVKKIYLLDEGIITPRGKILMRDYTTGYNEAVKLWKEHPDCIHENITCDVCKAEHSKVFRISSNIDYFDNSFQDRCFECLFTKRLKKSPKFECSEEGEDKQWKLRIFPKLHFAYQI